MARVFFAWSCVTSRDSPQMDSFLVNGWNSSRITAENGVPFFCLKQRVWNSYPRLGHNFPILIGKRSTCGGDGINSKPMGQLIQSSCMRSLYQIKEILSETESKRLEKPFSRHNQNMKTTCQMNLSYQTINNRITTFYCFDYFFVFLKV